MTARLGFKATNVFQRSFNSTKRIVIHRGGTRSSKTWSIAQQLAHWLATGWIRQNQYIPKGKATIVRKSAASLLGTSIETFNEVLETITIGDYTLADYVTWHGTNRTFTYQGRIANFIGADQEQKLRGNKCDILFCNEGNELGYLKEFFQLNVRTSTLTIIDFNPSDPYTWINEELEQKRMVTKGDVEVIHSTYLDNLENLNEEQISEIEYLKEYAYDLWAVYGLGEYGHVEGLILPDVTVIDEMPPGLRKRGYGMDFGFEIDPTTLVDCGVIGRNLYIDELFYQKGLLGNKIIDKMDTHYVSKSRRIEADHAGRVITQIANAGYNIHKAEKILIVEGLDILKQYKIHVTARSAGFLKEKKLYKWKVNRSGEVVRDSRGNAVPIDKWNHAIDAARYYAVHNLKSTPRRGKRRSSSV